MDIYSTALALGGVGLVGMAVGGFGRHGHGGHAGHGAHAGHAGHAGASHATGSPHGVSHAAHASGSNAQAGSANPLLALMSPRVLFSVLLGFGTAGIVLQNALVEPVLFAAALGVGI